ncbi:proprotein convertase subtilisin/kexin type 5-like [Armigeres subalbatus]|uniref:proprotein convertase subtilisin/kexin type 5-like n=1 Tax=Armigeres subalbatus TaxID=124917 RepID=UPI002ED1DA0F
MSTILSLTICGILIIPSIPTIGATTCAACSSADNPKCSAPNFTESTKDCFSVNPCAVSIITGTGHTFRGCSMDPECYSNDLCETCDGDGCNSGAYPADRMNCLTCWNASEGDASCETDTSDQRLGTACVLYFQDDVCVTIFKQFKPIRRGCLGDMDVGVKALCESGSAECVPCRENDCNTVNVRLDELCLQCDSQDRGCNDASHNATTCTKVSEGKCYSKLFSDGTVKRGCFHELSAEESTTCNTTNCVVCSGAGCNKSVFIAKNDFRCKTCLSSNTAACVRDPYTVLDKECPLNDTACATVLISATGHLFRGCSTDAECVAEGDGCIKCDEYRNCNFYRYPLNRLDCNICETANNPNCATLPYNKQFEKPCLRHISGDDCVTIFDGFRVTRRECRSALNESDLLKCDSAGGQECVACSGTGCNKITVRQDDNCLQCSSQDGLTCANGRRLSTVCKRSSDGFCYNRLDQTGILHRGCLSDLNEEDRQLCLNSNDSSCETCSGSGCNKNVFPVDALQCVQCDSSMNMDCVQNQTTNIFVNPCRVHVNEDKCYTRLRADGSIERGCQSSLVDACDPLTNASCTTCEGAACNTEVYPWGRRSCYQCDGVSDLTCGLEQTRQNGIQVCLRFKSHDKCYTLLQDGKVKRGCASEFDIDVCHGLEKTQCQTCNTNDCNHISEVGLRSNGQATYFSSLLALVGIFFVVLEYE